jgi:CO/xanthine dehydrogenase Mo-binding subunit
MMSRAGERPPSGGMTVRDRGVEVKAAGEFEFLTDRYVPDCLWAEYIRSPYPRAEVADFDAGALREEEGVVAVYTWADVPATRFNPALTPPDAVSGANRDKRMLTRAPRHVGDEVAVVVAGTRAQARAAARRAGLTWVPAEPVLTIDEALAAGRRVGSVQLGSERVGQLLDSADLTLRSRFEFAAAAHNCLETPACVAVPGRDGAAVEIWTNSQCPAEVRRQVAAILALDESAVRIRKVDEGGGFGSKQDLYAEPLAGWLAQALRRPVRFAHSRTEELTAGRVRAAGRIDLAMGFDSSGRLLATEMSAVLDCGAYVSHTPYVLSCLPGQLIAVYPRAPYRLHGELVATDTIPSGAYRGYGVAEANFAVEQVMDMAAARLSLRPDEIRLRNVVDGPGGSGLAACIRLLRDRMAPDELDEPAPDSTDLLRGRGLAVAAKHSVAGDSSDASTAEVALWPGPVLVLTTGTCDSGTGSSRALAQIVADELDVPLEDVLVCEGDTDRISDLGSTAQRSVFVGGESARRAALLARTEILRADGRADLTLRWPHLVDRDGVPVVDLADLAAHRPPGSVGARLTARAPGRGASYCALSVEVSVDPATGAIRVETADVVIDCGRVVDLAGARGQVAGGIVQGVGLACFEEWAPGPDGRGPGSMLDHGVPRATDTPVVSVVFNDPSGHRPPSGLGELPIIAVAAAVANAVAAATGVRCTRTPLRPAEVWRRIGDRPGRPW